MSTQNNQNMSTAEGGLITVFGGLTLFVGFLAVALYRFVRATWITILWAFAAVLLLTWTAGDWQILTCIAVLALAVASHWYLPVATPVVADWKRWKRKRDARRRHWKGYIAARDLGLVSPFEDEERAKKKGGRCLSRAFYWDDGITATLNASQQLAGTDDQIMTRAVAYAPTLGYPADWITIDRPNPGTVRITWARQAPADTLTEEIPFYSAEVDAGGHPTRLAPDAPVTIGMRADGCPFDFPIFGKQTLLLGASGSGKGSVIGSVLLALAPSIQSSIVRVVGIDLKGGVEFTAYRELFHRIAYTYEDAQVMLSEVAEDVLEPRLTFMRNSGLRKHAPTVDEPLYLVLIDEAASLTYLAPDNKAKASVDADMKRLLSTARAAGISVLAAMQDPRKESLASRDLFTQTVALRFRTKDDAVLALGQAAYDAGALCDRIPASQPGTGYVIDGDTGDVVRFRAFWVSDETIRNYAQRYAAPTPKG